MEDQRREENIRSRSGSQDDAVEKGSHVIDVYLAEPRRLIIARPFDPGVARAVDRSGFSQRTPIDKSCRPGSASRKSFTCTVSRGTRFSSDVVEYWIAKAMAAPDRRRLEIETLARTKPLVSDILDSSRNQPCTAEAATL